MKVVIVGKNRQAAIKFFDKLIEKLEFEENQTIILKQKEHLTEHLIRLDNGDTYQIINASDSLRGYRADKVYVQTGTDHKFIENILIPMLAKSKLFSIEQIEYFTIE